MKTRLRHCSTVLVALLLMSGLIACMDGRRSKRPQTGGAGSEKSVSATSEQPAGEEAGVPDLESGSPAPDTARTFVGVLFVYTFEPLTGVLKAGSAVEVAPDAAPNSALAALLTALNEMWKGGRRIEVAGVAAENGKKILTLDLVDSAEQQGVGSWYDSFQGSAGGASTEAFLVATFLQPGYAGAWFDGVRFLLNGQPVGEMDHVNLDRLFLRDRGLDQYAPLAVTGLEYPAHYEIEARLRAELDLDDAAKIRLVQLRTRNKSRTAVFFVVQPDRFVKRGVAAVSDEGLSLLHLEEDPCGCFDIQVQRLEMVPERGEFAVTRFSPVTGSCVGLDLVRVLAVSGEGAVLEVWSGSTFDAQGSKSQIASVEFTDRDGDGNLEILRRGRLVDCGDDCLCRDGPVLERFEAVYGWDEESGRFVERLEVGLELSPTSQ